MARQERTKKPTLNDLAEPDRLKGPERQLCQALNAQYEAQVLKLAPNFKFNPRSKGLEVWRPAAKLCLERHIDAEAYVRYVIEACTLLHEGSRRSSAMATLFPEYFNSKTVLQSWEDTNVISTALNPEVDAAAARRILYARCGTWAITPETIRVLQGRWAQIPAYMRLALAYEDPHIWEEFSWEGILEIRSSPGLQHRCIEIGLRVDEWVNRPAGPIPIHLSNNTN